MTDPKKVFNQFALSVSNFEERCTEREELVRCVVIHTKQIFIVYEDEPTKIHVFHDQKKIAEGEFIMDIHCMTYDLMKDRLIVSNERVFYSCEVRQDTSELEITIVSQHEMPNDITALYCAKRLFIAMESNLLVLTLDYGEVLDVKTPMDSIKNITLTSNDILWISDESSLTSWKYTSGTGKVHNENSNAYQDSISFVDSLEMIVSCVIHTPQFPELVMLCGRNRMHILNGQRTMAILQEIELQYDIKGICVLGEDIFMDTEKYTMKCSIECLSEHILHLPMDSESIIQGFPDYKNEFAKEPINEEDIKEIEDKLAQLMPNDLMLFTSKGTSEILTSNFQTHSSLSPSTFNKFINFQCATFVPSKNILVTSFGKDVCVYLGTMNPAIMLKNWEHGIDEEICSINVLMNKPLKEIKRKRRSSRRNSDDAYGLKACTVALASSTGKIYFHDLTSGKLEHSLAAHTVPVKWMGVDSGTGRIVTAVENCLKIWDPRSLALLHTISFPLNIASCEFGHGGWLIVTNGSGKTLGLSVVTGELNGELMTGVPGRKELMGAQTSESLRIPSSTLSHEQTPLKSQHEVSCMAFNRRENLLVSVFGCTAWIWRLHEGYSVFLRELRLWNPWKSVAIVGNGKLVGTEEGGRTVVISEEKFLAPGSDNDVLNSHFSCRVSFTNDKIENDDDKSFSISSTSFTDAFQSKLESQLLSGIHQPVVEVRHNSPLPPKNPPTSLRDHLMGGTAHCISTFRPGVSSGAPPLSDPPVLQIPERPIAKDFPPAHLYNDLESFIANGGDVMSLDNCSVMSSMIRSVRAPSIIDVIHEEADPKKKKKKKKKRKKKPTKTSSSHNNGTSNQQTHQVTSNLVPTSDGALIRTAPADGRPETAMGMRKRMNGGNKINGSNNRNTNSSSNISNKNNNGTKRAQRQSIHSFKSPYAQSPSLKPKSTTTSTRKQQQKVLKRKGTAATMMNSTMTVTTTVTDDKSSAGNNKHSGEKASFRPRSFSRQFSKSSMSDMEPVKGLANQIQTNATISQVRVLDSPSQASRTSQRPISWDKVSLDGYSPNSRLKRAHSLTSEADVTPMELTSMALSIKDGSISSKDQTTHIPIQRRQWASTSRLSQHGTSVSPSNKGKIPHAPNKWNSPTFSGGNFARKHYDPSSDSSPNSSPNSHYSSSSYSHLPKHVTGSPGRPKSGLQKEGIIVPLLPSSIDELLDDDTDTGSYHVRNDGSGPNTPTLDNGDNDDNDDDAPLIMGYRPEKGKRTKTNSELLEAAKSRAALSINLSGNNTKDKFPTAIFKDRRKSRKLSFADAKLSGGDSDPGSPREPFDSNMHRNGSKSARSQPPPKNKTLKPPFRRARTDRKSFLEVTSSSMFPNSNSSNTPPPSNPKPPLPTSNFTNEESPKPQTPVLTPSRPEKPSLIRRMSCSARMQRLGRQTPSPPPPLGIQISPRPTSMISPTSPVPPSESEKGSEHWLKRIDKVLSLSWSKKSQK